MKKKTPAVQSPVQDEQTATVTPITEAKKDTPAESFPDTLSQQDLSRLEIQSSQVQSKRLQVALEDQTLRNLTLEMELFKHRIESQKQKLQQAQQAHQNAHQIYDSFVKSLIPKYGIKPGASLAYNPMTGAIVRD